MSLLPPHASFEERIADLFTALRGQGFMLSALDAELLERWKETGAPVEVIARGIRKAVEGWAHDAPAGSSGLRSLRACSRQVDAEIRKYLALATGKPREPA